MTVGAEVDARVLVRKATDIGATRLPQAVGAALGRAGRSTRVAVVRRIRETWVIKASDLNRQIKVTTERATDVPSGTQSATLTAKGGPIPLRDFGARMTAKGVTYRIRRNQPRKVYRRGRAGFIVGNRPKLTRIATRSGRSVRKSAFGGFEPNPRYGGHAYLTRGSGRSPQSWKRLYGPGVAQRVAGRDIREVIRTTWHRQFPKELKAALQQRIRVAEAKARTGR